jgi:hydrogenase/urease accessory protein HupE
VTRVQVFLAGVWQFVVGDDWPTAIGVMLALGLTALIAETSISAWWVMPVAVLGLLTLSIWRASRSSSRRG